MYVKFKSTKDKEIRLVRVKELNEFKKWFTF